MTARHEVTSIVGRVVGEGQPEDTALAPNQLMLRALASCAIQWIRDSAREHGSVVTEVSYTSTLVARVEQITSGKSYGSLSTPGTCKTSYLIEEEFVIVGDLPEKVVEGLTFEFILRRALDVPFISATFETHFELVKLA